MTKFSLRLKRFIDGSRLILPTQFQRILDICIFLNIAGYFVWQTWKVLAENRLDFIEGLFILHNIIMCSCFILRTPAKAIRTTLSHQLVSICAFYSGMLFVGQVATENAILLRISWWLMLLGMLISIVSLLHLGKSFGVLIAIRELKSTGIYSIVRHPMYLSDIIIRLAYMASHPSLFVFILVAISSACYVLRSRLEERFWLDSEPKYAEYMEKVKYRFIPKIF